MNFQRNGRPAAQMQSGTMHRMHTVGEAMDNGGGFSAQNNKNAVKGVSLAMVYAPYQIWRNILDADTALSKGSVFAELIKPFCPCNKGV